MRKIDNFYYGEKCVLAALGAKTKNKFRKSNKMTENELNLRINIHANGGFSKRAESAVERGIPLTFGILDDMISLLKMA